MSFNSKFLIKQGRKKLNIQDSSLPKIQQKANSNSLNKTGFNQLNFSKKDLQETIEIYCLNSNDRTNEQKQFVLSHMRNLSFLKKAVKRKGEEFLISALNQMSLEYFSCDQELYNINEGIKHNFYILLNGSVSIYIQNDQFQQEEKEQNQNLREPLVENQNLQKDASQFSYKGLNNKIFNVEVKQMGQSMLRKKADGYIQKQREKENQMFMNRTSINLLHEQKAKQSGVKFSDNNKISYFTGYKQDGEYFQSSQKITNDFITKQRVQELNMIQQNLAKKQAREFKEFKVVSGLSTLGDKKSVKSEGNVEIQKIIVKSSQVTALVLKGDTFRDLFNEMLQSEEKINKISFFLSIPLFNNFKMREINFILQKTSIQSYKKFQVVYNENDVAQCVYIVKSGEFAIQKEIIIKNPLMPDIYGKKIVKNIEIYSLTEGQFFGIDELLGSSQLLNLQSSLSGDEIEINTLPRLYSVKCLTAESELFVIPYESFCKYINPEMIVIEQKSLESQAKIRSEMIYQKQIQEERKQMKMIAMKRNVQSECSKYHLIQDEINTQEKQKQYQKFQKNLNVSSSAVLLPTIEDENNSIQSGKLIKQISFNSGSFITQQNEIQKNTQNEEQNKFKLNYFSSKQIDNNGIQHNNRYLNQLEKLPNKYSSSIDNNNRLSNNLKHLEYNIQQFNQNIFSPKQNMTKQQRAVSVLNQYIKSEPSPFWTKQKMQGQNNRSQSVVPQIDEKIEKSNNTQERNKTNQINYVLITPQQTRQRRSQTTGLNYQQNKITPILTNQKENGILSPKNMNFKLQKVENFEQVRQSNNDGVQKVDGLYKYLNDQENKSKGQHSLNKTLTNKEFDNINYNKKLYNRNSNHLHRNQNNQRQHNQSMDKKIQKQIHNYRSQLQSISSYKKIKDLNNKQYLEDVDEIENNLNRKDIMIQIINNNNNNNSQNIFQKGLNSRLNYYSSQADQSDNTNDTQNEKRNKTPYSQQERNISQNTTQHKSQTKKQFQNKSLNQYDQTLIEQLLEEINQNYSKVPIKPLMISPSNAVKNAKRQIKKSRKDINYPQNQVGNCYVNQSLQDLNLQNQSTLYNYNLQFNNKKLDSSSQQNISFQKE